MRHMDEDYEVGGKHSLSIIEHFHDTIRIVGGWQGIIALTLGVMVFYGFVLYTVTTGRERRQREAMAKRQ